MPQRKADVTRGGGGDGEPLPPEAYRPRAKRESEKSQ